MISIKYFSEKQETKDLILEKIDGYNPIWKDRIIGSLDFILDSMYDETEDILEHLDKELNLVQQLKDNFKDPIVKTFDKKQKAWVRDMQNKFEEHTKTINKLTSVGYIIQSIIGGYYNDDLILNNANSYPDLISRQHDYSVYKKWKRSNPLIPSIKGGLPCNVPDGIEIKTTVGKKIKVGAHYPHEGLHLGFTWEQRGCDIIINGVFITFALKGDYTVPRGDKSHSGFRLNNEDFIKIIGCSD